MEKVNLTKDNIHVKPGDTVYFFDGQEILKEEVFDNRNREDQLEQYHMDTLLVFTGFEDVPVDWCFSSKTKAYEFAIETTKKTLEKLFSEFEKHTKII